MRRVSAAHADSHEPDGTEPYLTESGMPIMPQGTAFTGNGDGDVVDEGDIIYPIERILRAERVGNKYRIWIKWEGSEEITFRWRHELVEELSDEGTLKEIEDAVAVEKATTSTQRGGPPETDDADLTEKQDTAVYIDPADDRPISQRLRRVRAAPVAMVTPSSDAYQLVSSWLLTSVYGVLAACDDTLRYWLGPQDVE